MNRVRRINDISPIPGGLLVESGPTGMYMVTLRCGHATWAWSCQGAALFFGRALVCSTCRNGRDV
jgi:hypothetical protein